MSQDDSEFSDRQRERAARYLAAQLFRSQCPGVTRLNHYCAGMLSDEETASIASHIQSCPLCAEDVAHIRRTLNNFEPFPEESLNEPDKNKESASAD